MSKQVASVLDEDEADAIRTVAFGMPIWLVGTKDNAALVSDLRRSSNEVITTFVAIEGESKSDLT